MKLAARLIEKPWGQIGVPHALIAAKPDARIGEVCFEDPGGRRFPLLLKYLYTSERLSIQVHPDNAQAQAKGHASGKDEMWVVLDAAPDARLGIGLVRDVTHGELQSAIADGSIVDLVDWRAVRKGDVVYNKAGTIHAAGAGLVLVEVQQSIDLTYRLFDYGRPRELHISEGLAVSRLGPHDATRDSCVADGRSRILVEGPYFGAAWCAGSIPAEVPENAGHYQVLVIEGEAEIEAEKLASGEAGVVASLSSVKIAANSQVLVAWAVGDSGSAAR